MWRFAGCEFDESRRELRVRGTPADLEAKPLEVLHQLLLHAGEVVTKDELLESVWGGTTVVDGSLATAISKVRKALSNDDRIVVTIPRVGYRLDVPVEVNRPPAPEWAGLDLKTGDAVPGREQWQLMRRLGLSPSSVVWLAENPKTHESRVFKFVPDRVRLKGLKREVTLARLLRELLGDCSEFVRMLEWNLDTPPYFVETEYCGPNLAEWADAQGGLREVPLESRLRILARVAAAVAAAHGVGVLHKDLKPANILVARGPDGGWRVKVADFGCASLLQPERLDALGITNLGFTETGSTGKVVTGTAMYVAPEVLGGLAPTAAADVYALGVLLYQLVVADFRKPLAPGWEADVEDSLIRQDIAEAACGDPAKRISTAEELARRVVSLDQRRSERVQQEKEHQDAQAAAQQREVMRGRRSWLILTGAALLVVGIVSWYFYRYSSSDRIRVRTIAVLPFRNVGSGQEADHLRLALADEVATILNQVRGFSVRPFATTSRYDQPGVLLQEAGRAMHAEIIVTGHFARTEEQLSLTLEAVDVESNRVVWRDMIEAPAHRMIAAQVLIALRVRGGLAPAFGASAPDPSVQPTDEEAYNLFLRSVALAFDAVSNRQALELLERSVKRDPAYAPALMSLARRYYAEARYVGGNTVAMERYEATLERAVSLQPNYAPAAAGLIVSRVERGDLVRAHRQAQELVRRRPDSADAHFALSYALRYAGLLREAQGHCETAYLLDARTQNSGLRSCVITFMLLGDYPRALNYLHLDLGSGWTKAFTIDLLVREGKHQQALQVGPPQMPQWSSYDMIVACVGSKPPSEIRALAAAVRPSEDPEANYLFAAHLAYCGQTTSAFEMLRRAINGKYCSYPAIDTDPLLSSLRTKPEFGEIRNAAMECQRSFLAGKLLH